MGAKKITKITQTVFFSINMAKSIHNPSSVKEYFDK